MIYTDGVHIISDAGVQELHWFAERVGIGRWWFENRRDKNHPHYDRPRHVPTNKLVIKGARYATTRHIVEILKNTQHANMLPNKPNPI